MIFSQVGFNSAGILGLDRTENHHFFFRNKHLSQWKRIRGCRLTSKSHPSTHIPTLLYSRTTVSSKFRPSKDHDRNRFCNATCLRSPSSLHIIIVISTRIVSNGSWNDLRGGGVWFLKLQSYKKSFNCSIRVYKVVAQISIDIISIFLILKFVPMGTLIFVSSRYNR